MSLKKTFIKKLYLRILFLLFSISLSSEILADGPAFLRESYRHFKTEHFHIIYAQTLQAQASKLAATSEEAYSLLRKQMGYSLSEPVTLVFVDTFDAHNGSTTSIPHNSIFIFVNNYFPLSSIPTLETDRDLRLTILHELTHAFNLDLRTGSSKWLAKIFGKAYPVNDIFSVLLFYFGNSSLDFAPTWYLEGTATWAETALTNQGRGRSTTIDAIFRTAVRDNTLLPPQQWSLNTPDWPYGGSVYYYGLRMMEYVASTQKPQTNIGQNPIGALTEKGADHFLFNSLKSFDDVSGQDWYSIAEEMLVKEKTQQAARLKELSAVPLTPTPQLSPQSVIANMPIFIGAKIAYIDSPRERETTVAFYDPATKKTTKLSLRHDAIGSLSATADGRFLYYNYLDVQDGENYYFHINRKDLVSGSESTIANRGRYIHFNISPDGQTLIATTQRAGLSYLVEIPVERASEASQEKILYQTPFGVRLESPRFSPDGRWISFVEFGDNHQLKLLAHQKNARPSTLLTTQSHIVSPTWHPLGDRLVLSSDLTGVFNLYQLAVKAVKKDGTTSAKLEPLTHVDGGLFSPALSATGKEVAAISLGGLGSYLTILPYPEKPLANLPHITSTWDYLPPPPVAATPAITAPTDKPYNSLTNIGLDFWAPWLIAGYGGTGAQVGAQIHLSDPLAYQTIDLYGGRDVKDKANVSAIFYSYNGFIPKLNFYVAADVEGYPLLLSTPSSTGIQFHDYGERTRYFGFSVTQPLYTDLVRRLSLTAGIEHKTRSTLNDFRGIASRSIIPPDTGARNAVYGRLDYDNTIVFPRSVSAERGLYLSLAADRSRKEDGDKSQLTRIISTNAVYVPSLWDNHVIRLIGVYGNSTGDTFAQGAFGVGGVGNVLTQIGRVGIPDRVEIRGYPYNAEIGKKVAQMGVSYRLPLWNLFRSHESAFPLYNRSLFGEVFYEQGKAWDTPTRFGQVGWLRSTGVGINYGLTILRYLNLAPGIGVAYTPDNPKINSDYSKASVFITIKGWVNP